MRDVRSHLADVCRDLDLGDHQLMEAIIARAVSYYGQTVDLTSVVETSVTDLSGRVIAAASQLWGGGADLHHILITGGGAHLIGDRIKSHFSKHQSVSIVPDPVLANARGFYRFARYLEVNNSW